MENCFHCIVNAVYNIWETHRCDVKSVFQVGDCKWIAGHKHFVEQLMSDLRSGMEDWRSKRGCMWIVVKTVPWVAFSNGTHVMSRKATVVEISVP